MRLGIGSFSYPWAVGVPGQPQPAAPMNAFALLEAATKLGVQSVQYVDNLSLMHLSARDRAELKSLADDAGIQIEVGMRGTDASEIRMHLSFVKEFGSNYLRIMTDGVSPNDTPGSDQIIERLMPLTDEFEDAGVRIALENFDRFTAYDTVGMVEALGAGDVAGVCLDTVNNFGAGEGWASVVETLAPYTINLHLKDFRVTRKAHRLGFEINGVPVGQGQLDVQAILAQMPESVSVTLEQWTPFDTDIDTTCREEARHVAESIAYLKPLIP
ncbi:MAG: sugar phosphate isomerase/epimerase [Armatimonadetes bacterium]|nr:sugar phosphate isomerase/epimerase [Armatimonadota bacterium]